MELQMTSVWATTVTIDTGETPNDFARIHSTKDAAYFLLDHWQRDRSPAYCTAIRLCAKAIKGEASHEAAYIAFMAAVREANVTTVTSRRRREDDQLSLAIGTALAEGILLELRAIWASDTEAQVRAKSP